MAEPEPKPVGPQTLKNQIHEARADLRNVEILAMGDQGLCGVYESLFALLRQWIQSKGDEEQKNAMEKVVIEYESTHRQRVYCEIGIRNRNTLYKYTIDHDPNTLEEATDANVALREKYLENVTWGTLKRKRMIQYQKLWDIFKDMTDADEDVGSQFKRSRDII